jgi:hypothetical protein
MDQANGVGVSDGSAANQRNGRMSLHPARVAGTGSAPIGRDSQPPADTSARRLSGPARRGTPAEREPAEREPAWQPG